jgi:hypothetical protein
MTLTERDCQILFLLRRYVYLRTNHIRDLVAPHDDDGSIVRGRLRKLSGASLIRRYQPRLVDLGGSIAPIFALTMKGANALVAARGDSSLSLSSEPNFADWMSMNHYCALSALHILIDQAIAAQNYVRMHALYFEHEIVQPDIDDATRKYRLHTLVSETPRVVCCPDSAFELEVSGYRRALYVEREMGTDTPARVAAKKCKGYAGLESGLFRRHFPHARDVRVLWLCPNAGWRDALRREMRGKPGCAIALFASAPELTSASVLHTPLWYSTEQGPLPLVTAPALPTASSPPQGAQVEMAAEVTA